MKRASMAQEADEWIGSNYCQECNMLDSKCYCAYDKYTTQSGTEDNDDFFLESSFSFQFRHPNSDGASSSFESTVESERCFSQYGDEESCVSRINRSVGKPYGYSCSGFTRNVSFCSRYSVSQCDDSCSGCLIFSAQSGLEDASVMKITRSEKQQNVAFADQHEAYMYDVDAEIDPTRKLQDSSDATLENFFSRPIKIREVEWGTSTTLFDEFNPWQLYMDNSRVVNRIANFNLLRSVLNIKIVINGNGFQYGRALASYLPLAAFDNLTTNVGLFPEDIVQASQMPHIYLDPTTSTGGSMKLPFFYHKNYLNISEVDWSELGRITIRSINSLKHANGAIDKVTVSVFAWVEDVSMSVLTSVEPGSIGPQFTAQSGTEQDEANSKGFISRPASAIAKAAGNLKSIPQIAPFATATELAAGTAAKVARSLGYCRPPVTQDPAPFKPVPISSMALTTVPDTTQKMTVDDKQELTLDPRIAGLGSSDPMSIKDIAARESYLTTFNWDIGVSPESLLWNARIDPVTWVESTQDTSTAFHFPACAMAALPFKYWTGSMKFRFQVVCSAFHKGRLKIVYDPNYLGSNEYNTNYLQIIDIADTNDFTIEVGNGQEVTLLRHHDPGEDSVTQMYSTTPYTSREAGNGVLGVYVVNELTTPNSTADNDIQINVFVSMGDDFEVFVPDDYFQRFVVKPPPPALAKKKEVFDTQSGAEIVPEGQNTNEPSAPQQMMSMNVGPTPADNDLVNRVYTGESITSFRQLLKRYNCHTALATESTGATLLSGTRSMYPYLRGYLTGAIDQTSDDEPYNYCNTLMIHWLTLAHSGWRGSVRYKLVMRGQADAQGKPNGYIYRVPIGEVPQFRRFNSAAPSYNSSSEAAESVVMEKFANYSASKMFPGANAVVYQNGDVNPNFEFELPYYSPYRFTPGKSSAYHTGTSDFVETWEYRITVNGSAGTAVDIHTCCGEDFQVYFWTALPRLYYEQFPPTPGAAP